MCFFCCNNISNCHLVVRLQQCNTKNNLNAVFISLLIVQFALVCYQFDTILFVRINFTLHTIGQISDPKSICLICIVFVNNYVIDIMKIFLFLSVSIVTKQDVNSNEIQLQLSNVLFQRHIFIIYFGCKL